MFCACFSQSADEALRVTGNSRNNGTQVAALIEEAVWHAGRGQQ